MWWRAIWWIAARWWARCASRATNSTSASEAQRHRPASGLRLIQVVILEIRGELGGALLLGQQFQPAQCRHALLGAAAAAGRIHVLGDARQVDLVAFGVEALVIGIFKLVRFLFLV